MIFPAPDSENPNSLLTSLNALCWFNVVNILYLNPRLAELAILKPMHSATAFGLFLHQFRVSFWHLNLSYPFSIYQVCCISCFWKAPNIQVGPAFQDDMEVFYNSRLQYFQTFVLALLCTSMPNQGAILHVKHPVICMINLLQSNIPHDFSAGRLHMHIAFFSATYHAISVKLYWGEIESRTLA